MRLPTIVLFMLPALAVASSPHEVQLFNPDVFGKTTSEPVKLLLDKNAPGDIEPYVVWTDIQCGRYIAASVYYRKPVTVADLGDSVNRLYAAYEVTKVRKPASWLWRVEDKRFAIQLVEEGDEGVGLIYLHFAPATEVAKGWLRGLGAVQAGRGSKKAAEGFGKVADAMGESDCAEWEHMFAPEGTDEEQR